MGVKGVFKFFGVRAFEGVVAIILILIMPNVPPDAKFQKSYTVDTARPFEGKLAINDRLRNVEVWHKGDITGPEAFASFNGELYTTIYGGDIVKLTGEHITPVAKFGKPCKGLYQESICGRPLGMDFDKDGALYVCDAYYGVYKVDVKTGKKIQIVSTNDEIDGKKPKLPNSINVVSNGDFYWTDSSTEFDLQNGVFDLLADGSGRLIHYNAKTKTNTVLLDGIHFANGIYVSDDESYVLVSETARNRIIRYYLKGSKKGTSDIFISGLPGLSDNIQVDGKGGFLIPLIISTDQRHPLITQIMGPFPILRKFVSRVFGLIELGFKVANEIYENEFSQRAVHFIGHFESGSGIITNKRCTLLHISKDGEILDSLHTDLIQSISEAFIHKNVLYLGSPFNDFIGRISLERAGLKHLMSDPKVKEVKTEPVTQKPQVEKVESSTQKLPQVKEAPTTQRPQVKEAPTTQKPQVKEAPTTQKPQVKEVPTSQKPRVKEAPITQKPQVKEAPTTQKPQVKQESTTQKPQVKQTPPTQKPPVKEVPSTKNPQVKEVPSTPKPQAKEIPSIQKPQVKETVKPQIKEAPSTQKPPVVKAVPTTEKPAVKETPTKKPQVKEVPSTPTPQKNIPKVTKSAPATPKPVTKESPAKQAPPKVQSTGEIPTVDVK